MKSFINFESYLKWTCQKAWHTLLLHHTWCTESAHTINKGFHHQHVKLHGSMCASRIITANQSLPGNFLWCKNATNFCLQKVLFWKWVQNRFHYTWIFPNWGETKLCAMHMYFTVRDLKPSKNICGFSKKVTNKSMIEMNCQEVQQLTP